MSKQKYCWDVQILFIHELQSNQFFKQAADYLRHYFLVYIYIL